MTSIEDLTKAFGKNMEDNNRKANGRQLSYSTGILGIGDIGSAIAEKIPEIDRINSIRLFTRNEQKGYHVLNNLVDERHIKTAVSHPDALEEMVHDLDILVISIDNSRYRELMPNITRKDVLDKNLFPLVRLSEKIKGYDRSVIVVTNPVEAACQIVAEYSGIAPELITGLSHTDLVRFRKDLRKDFASHGLGDEIINLMRTYMVGTHTYGNAVGYFDIDGLKRDQLKFMGETLFNHIVKSALEFTEAFELSEKFGITDANQTAVATKEVMQAIISEDWEKSPVRTSLFIKPELLGIKGAISGAFDGYPTYFKDFAAHPDPNFSIFEKTEYRIDDQKKQEQIREDYTDLEADLQDLQENMFKIVDENNQSIQLKEGLKLNLERRVKYEDSRRKPKKKALKKVMQEDIFDSRDSVVAVSHTSYMEWPDLNNPNLRIDKDLDWRVEAFSVPRVGDAYFNLFAQYDGVSVNKVGTKKNRLMKINRVREKESFRSVKLRMVENELYIFAGTHDFVYMLDFKTGKIVETFSGWNGSLNNFDIKSVGNQHNLYVAANNIHKHSFDNPQEPSHVFKANSGRNKVTDIAVIRNKLYGSVGRRIHTWNIMNPYQAPFISQDIPLSRISCFSAEKSPDHDFIFVGTYDSKSYLLSGSMGDVNYVYEKAEGNKNGTGRIGLRAIGDDNYLFASDKNMQGTQNAEISISDVMNPEKPLVRLRTHRNHSIRGFGVTRKK